MVDNAMQRETTTTGHDELRRQSRLHSWAKYLQVFGTFARNSLIRDMTFRDDFIIQLISSTSFVIMFAGLLTTSVACKALLSFMDVEVHLVQALDV